MQISKEVFFKYMLKSLSEGSAKSYVSYISTAIPDGYENLLNGCNLLEYMCTSINNNDETDFAHIFILQVQEDLIYSDNINDRTLRNCLSALRKFEQYVSEVYTSKDNVFIEKTTNEVIVDNEVSETGDIEWFEIEKKYLSPRITPSQKMSIKENFKFRLRTQSRNGSQSIPFPIKLILSVYTNAAKESGISNPVNLARIESCKLDIDNIIDSLTDRILFYVKDETPRDDALWTLRIPNGMWAYTLCSLKAIGFDGAGGFYIKLHRSVNNILQVYTCDFANGKTWRVMNKVNSLADIELDHDPTVDDILKHNKTDFKALPLFNKMIAQFSITKSGDLKNNPALWSQLIPILEDLAKEVKIILSYYNLDALQRDDNRQKQIIKNKLS